MMMKRLLFRRSRRFGNGHQERTPGAHSSASFLSNEQVAELGKELDDRAVQLRHEIRERLIESGEDHAVSLIDQRGVRDDEALADLLSDLDIADITRDLDEVREIESARLRLRAGNIGTCASCGGAITFGRLRANPVARRCIDCQRTTEQGQRHAATL